ncbi:MAG TPA: carboxypeptidase-like regulatory domain-containing protein [Bryobacteraceae bacterium]
MPRKLECAPKARFPVRTYLSSCLLISSAACLLAPSASWAGDTALKSPVKLSGAIGGRVTNSAGLPQMGASVVLYNRQDRAFDRVVTDERGEFRFPRLFPDVYAVRVTLATFVPALKRDILVQPGMRALLNVSLNTLFSSIQVAYPPAGGAALMNEDWKWVLRSASSTRPVLRFDDGSGLATSGKTSQGPRFSDARGLLQLSAGDGPLETGTANQADLGTAFVLATSVFGNNHLELSGNVGYGAQTGVPATAFRTSYTGTGGPTVSVTMRQIYLPGKPGALGFSDAASPALRAVSASVDQRTELTEDTTVQYGFTMDSVAFVGDRVTYMSPYFRLAYSPGGRGIWSFAYTSGNARPDLGFGQGDTLGEDAELQRDLGSVGLFPRTSLLNGQPRVQRGKEMELSYARKFGSRTVKVSGYREAVTDAALSLVGPGALYNSEDLLPDLFTGNAIFNAGNYSSSGYNAALTQQIGPNVSATVLYGIEPGLSAATQDLVSNSPDELRSMIRASHHQAVTARIAGASPWTGTRVIASYQWVAENGWLNLGNLYSTEAVRPLPGLNIFIKQPIPGLPWRVEATCELRNMLAEGYLPVENVGGSPALLVATPRGLRGGLSFTF